MLRSEFCKKVAEVVVVQNDVPILACLIIKKIIVRTCAAEGPYIMQSTVQYCPLCIDVTIFNHEILLIE